MPHLHFIVSGLTALMSSYRLCRSKNESILTLRWHRIRSPNRKHTKAMGNLLYIIAVILVIGWLLGVFVYSATGLIHLLLVIAIIAILLQVIRGRKVL